MDKQNLQKIGEGLYMDAKSTLYVDMNEFIDFYKLPTEADTRTAILEQIKREFDVEVKLLNE